MDKLDQLMAWLELWGGVVGGIAALVITLILVRVGMAFRQSIPKKVAPPKNLVEPSAVVPKWTDDAAYQAAMKRLFDEIQAAIRAQDVETLEVIAQGPALATFKKAMQADALEQGDTLTHTAIQTWDPDKHIMNALFLVARNVQGRWKQFRELWTLEKRGGAWFVINRQPAPKSN